MSLPRKTEQSSFELFRNRLENIIDDNHELVRLTRLVDWQNIDRMFGVHFVPNVGRPAVRTRLMAGLLYLKYLHNLSDEQVVLVFVRILTGNIFVAKNIFNMIYQFTRHH